MNLQEDVAMKRCCLALSILMFAAACGEHSKVKSEKYVYFDVTVSGQSENLVPKNAVVNTTDLLAYDRPYQRPLVNGHARFFANTKVKTRKFRLDFSARETDSSLITQLVNDWQPLPTVQVSGCKLGYADLVTIPTSDNAVEYRLQAKADQNMVTGNDCAGHLIGNMVFALQGPSTSNNVVCMAQDLPNSFTTVLNSSQVGVTNAKPRKRMYLCNVSLNDNSSLITASGVSQYGYDFSIQAYHVTDFDITSWNGFVGYLVYIDENGNASPVLPHIPGTLPSIPFTSVTLEVRSYGGLNNPLEAYCNFNGLWQPVPMSLSYALGTTLVVSQSVTFANVPTDNQYACNFRDTVTGQWIYFPPPSTASDDYIFLVNGLQAIDPNGNNLKVELDGAGQILVPLYTVTFTAIPINPLTPEVNLILGYAGIYKSYPMQLQGGEWMVTLSIPKGDWEANPVYTSGAYHWLTEGGEAGAFYVADISGNVPLPGVRMDQDTNAIMYASLVTGPPPTYLISHHKNYFFRYDYAGINGQNLTISSTGFNISGAPAFNFGP